MKAGRLLSLGFACVLLATLSVAAGATPLADPCTSTGGYDPACDANQDGQITVTDIQLTAGHWNQTGTWVSDNQHNHLGQTWTGSSNPLKLTGSYGTPEFAPLVLANTSGYGLRVAAAASSGVFVNSAGTYGLHVNTATDDGLRVTSAGGNGVFVEDTDLNGIYVSESVLDGMFVLSAGNYGLRINESGLDGVAVISSGGDGVDVAAATDNGIEATGTNRAAYFDGDVEIINGTCIGCTIAQLAVNTGDETLLPGHIVAVDGVTASPFDGLTMLLQVRRATPGSALLGVVSGRAEPYTSQEDKSYTLVHRAGQPAAPGDYLSVVIYGPVQVKVAGRAEIGQRLTVDKVSGVRAMRRVVVDGVTLDEGGSSLGMALNSAEDGLVWVLVNPQ